ncbi:DivIVA domain-containing protein [Blastococcus sp. SYSU D00922]
MTSVQNEPADEERGLHPADVQNVRFTRASMLRPGYVDTEVDRVMSRVAEELARHIAEKAALRDEVRALRAAVDGAPVHEAPSDQAVRILSAAQQTADAYVAEAEEFSRQMTSEARTVYEEELQEARERAGAIIQAAQEAAARMTGPAPAGADAPGRSVEELEEQVAYLKAFGSAVRVQLRSYLEALITDVETEWGRADPAAVLQGPPRPPAQRGRDAEPGGATAFSGNTVAEAPPADDEEASAAAGFRSSS